MHSARPVSRTVKSELTDFLTIGAGVSELDKTPEPGLEPEDETEAAKGPAPITKGRIYLWVGAGLVALYFIGQGVVGILTDGEPTDTNSEITSMAPAFLEA